MAVSPGTLVGTNYDTNKAAADAGMSSVIDVGADGSLSQQYWDYPTDPYAKWGGANAYNSLRQGFNNQKQGILDTVGGAINTSKRTLEGGVDSFLQNYKTQQRNINEGAIGAEMSKSAGRQGVLDMVGRGMRSAGQMLGNRNAGSSSASQAFAELYRDQGGRQMNKVEGQYQEGMRQVGQQQADLGDQAGLYQRNLEREKASSIDAIVGDAQNKLAALDAAMAEASLPDRIAIEDEKNNIRNQAVAALSSLDQMLSGGMGQAKSLSGDERLAEASRRSMAGVAPTNSYSFDTALPGQFNSGATSGLPIYTGRREDERA